MRYFFWGSCVLFMSCVCRAFASVRCCLVARSNASSLWSPAGKGMTPIGSRLWCLIVFLSLSDVWYPGSGVVLDCIDSWSLPPFLLLYNLNDFLLLIFISFSFTNKSAEFIWASARENLSSGVCEQHRRRPVCASAQTDQRLFYSLFGKYHM